jgi:DNA polymerase-3 subunit epsilon
VTSILDDNPTDRWVAIDFETATSERCSACSLGLAVIENGIIVDTRSWLIRPPANAYDWRNTSIHGISAQHTEFEPGYDELYPAIRRFLEGEYLLAHSAAFDVSVLRALHSRYGIALPRAKYACSCHLARRAFPALANHKLPTVCGHCGISLEHHDAASDALACARVALSCCDAVGERTVASAIGRLGLATARL